MVRLTAPAEANGPKYCPGRVLRRPMVAGDQNIGKRLVVAQLHIEARPQLLDQIGLEQQRLGLGRGRDDLDRHGGRDHAQDAGRLRRVDARIGGKPLADIFRLADVQHVAGRVQHAVDAGRGGRKPHRLFDRGMADRERAFRHALTGLLGNLRQPRLVVLVGGGHRGVEIGSRQVLRRQLRIPRSRFGTAPRLSRGRCFRVVGRIVIHGLKLKRRKLASPDVAAARGRRVRDRCP
jgi:hypothetical protein